MDIEQARFWFVRASRGSDMRVVLAAAAFTERSARGR